MTSPAPQKEYIITEEQLRDLIYARYVKEGGTETEDDEVHEQIKEILMAVRGRSATTSAEQDDVDTVDTIVSLKKKYRNELAIIDALELVEDELLALRAEARER